jgi:hypothetical protein
MFVAGLELARNGTAHLEQGAAFGPIHLAAADHQRALAFEAAGLTSDVTGRCARQAGVIQQVSG